MKHILTKKEIDKISEIMLKLVLANMAAGAGYEEAKAQAFNRMEKEYHSVLMAWCLCHEEKTGGK